DSHQGQVDPRDGPLDAGRDAHQPLRGREARGTRARRRARRGGRVTASPWVGLQPDTGTADSLWVGLQPDTGTADSLWVGLQPDIAPAHSPWVGVQPGMLRGDTNEL